MYYVTSYNVILCQANVTDNDKPGLEIDLHNNIVKASCQILQALQNVLRPTPLPGRYHYLFTLKDLTTCYQVSYFLIVSSKLLFLE
jgi:hypothetical protein